MKNISLITIHNVANFGSVLQTIATVKALEKAGCKAKVVNYIQERFRLRNTFRDCHSIKSFISNILYFPNKIINKYVYGKFLKKHVTLTHPIFAQDKFFSKEIEADIYVVGSDQVWNSTYNSGLDGHYFWEGIPQDSIKISFASSIGKTKLSIEEKQQIKKYLKSFKALSVREESCVILLRELGLDPIQLPDPTFMLNKDEWSKYISKRIVQQKYILVYTPYNTVDKGVIFRSARRLAEKYSLKVITFSWSFNTDKSADYTVRYADPGDFLSLFFHAAYVLTNSFHGTAFSINLNKKFWVYMPSGFTTRLESLLDLCSLKSRILTGEISEDDMLSEIDYSGINRRLEHERIKSMEFLRTNCK